MKKFAVFMGDIYYPLGGFHDFKASFDTLKEARVYIKAQKRSSYDWYHIVDIEQKRIIERVEDYT